jgi:hypothetical protein
MTTKSKELLYTKALVNKDTTSHLSEKKTLPAGSNLMTPLSKHSTKINSKLNVLEALIKIPIPSTKKITGGTKPHPKMPICSSMKKSKKNQSSLHPPLNNPKTS